MWRQHITSFMKRQHNEGNNQCFMFLLKVGKSKKFAKIKAWTGHIITHFWHCCETCAPVPTTSEKERISNLKVCIFVT